MKWINFFNLGNAFLTNISPVAATNETSEWMVRESHLGFFECKQVEFTQFEDIEILRSNLTGMRLYESDFPVPTRGKSSNRDETQEKPKWKRTIQPWLAPTMTNPITAGDAYSEEEEKDKFYHAIYEVYRDLGKAASDQKDVDQHIRYHAAGQQALLRAQPKGWRKNLPNKITLWMAWRFSNYGQNWVQAVGWTVGIAALLYWAYLGAVGIGFGWDVGYTLEVWGKFFMALNPVHAFDFLKEQGAETNAGSDVIDFFMRLFVALGGFEVLRSFRKYVRK